MVTESTGGWIFDRSGSHLALDFSNSVSGRSSPSPIDRLPSYADVVEFARQTEAISDTEARALLGKAKKHPVRAEGVKVRARELRDALHGLFTAVAERKRAAPGDVAVLNEHVARLYLDVDLNWRYEVDEEGLEAVFGPIVLAALELIEAPLSERVRVCGSDTCQFLFLDTTKSGTRRWCEMKTCGNREKARRYRGQVNS